MGLDDSNEDFVGTSKSVTSVRPVINGNIHEMDTQIPFPTETYEASDAVNTQLSTNHPSISGLDTHTIKMNNLPESKKINEQQDMKLDLFTENKENNNSIYNAETQQFIINENIEAKKQINNKNVEEPREETSNSKLNISDEEIIFDEIDSQPLAEDFESQPLLPAEILNIDESIIKSNCDDISKSNKIHINGKQMIRARLNSDSSTDCDDFDLLPTQKIQETTVCGVENKITANNVSVPVNKLTNVNDDDSTDCEDNAIKPHEKDPKTGDHVLGDNNDSTDCEDNEISCNLDDLKRKDANVIDFEDLATQVIAMDVPNGKDDIKGNPDSDLSFEDMPTQVLETVDMQNTSKKLSDVSINDLPTQVLPMDVHDEMLERNEFSENKLPFKVPLQCIKRNKKNEIIKTKAINTVNTTLDDDNFYNATQDVYNDLCTQNELITEGEKLRESNCNLETKNNDFINKTQMPVLNTHNVNKSSEVRYDKFNKLETSLPSEVKDIVGKDERKNKILSDSSDVECTPKKPMKFMETVLPNSQEIKKSVRLKTATTFAESPSDSEQENDEEEYASIISRKIKSQIHAKTELAKKFETESLPTRVLTRVRKPTAKLQNSNMDINNMMRSRLITEPEENIDTEIITENILRLKGKVSKRKVGEEIKCSSETKSDHKQSHELQNDKEVLTHLLNTIIKKESHEKIDAKRKSNESQRNGNEKSKKDSKNQKKSKSSNKNLKINETKNDNNMKPMDVKKNGRIHNKGPSLVEDVQKNDKISEKSSRRSPRTRGSAQANEKQEKKRESSEKEGSVKRAEKEKDEVKQSSKDENSKNKSDRSTRSRRKEQSVKKIESKSSTSDRIQSSEKGNKRKRNNDAEGRNESSSEKEMRRSKRQKTIKNYLEPNPAPTSRSSSSDSKLKNHEQSAVYSLSSESGVDSPANQIKRSEKLDMFNSNKKRSASNFVNNASLRATPRNIKTHKVLFTAFPCEEVKTKLMKLGKQFITILIYNKTRFFVLSLT